MKRFLIITCALVLTGCAQRPHAAVVRSTPSSAGVAPAAPNLALGTDAELAWMAGAYTYRSDWPSVEGGYTLEDWQSYTDVQSDQQFFHNRLGGYYRTSVGVRSITVVR